MATRLATEQLSYRGTDSGAAVIDEGRLSSALYLVYHLYAVASAKVESEAVEALYAAISEQDFWREVATRSPANSQYFLLLGLNGETSACRGAY